jgi:hypothetical protein
MLKLLLKLAPALEAGKELKDSALWKSRQDTTNRIVAVITLIIAVVRMQWPDMIPISDEDIVIASAWIATGLFGLNSFFTRVTSKKIGSKKWKSLNS